MLLQRLRTRLIYNFIKNNPDCIQQDIITFMGSERRHIQTDIWALLSYRYIKYRPGKQLRKHYSIDKRRKI